MMSLKMKYFTLKPDGQCPYAEASRQAMKAYADSIEAHNEFLAKDLRNWANKAFREAHEPVEEFQARIIYLKEEFSFIETFSFELLPGPGKRTVDEWAHEYLSDLNIPTYFDIDSGKNWCIIFKAKMISTGFGEDEETDMEILEGPYIREMTDYETNMFGTPE